ncbi:MAG: FliH/SctL family protein [Vicinamibacterales bacterium]
MSSRARLVSAGSRIESFDWKDVSTGDASGSVPAASRPLAPSPERSPAAVESTPEPELKPEQQARLAALERDAFAKGYAQGERAGMEAGAKRIEAMLRRLSQTLEELGQLRQTIAKETEREVVQLALALARRIVHREVTLDPTLVAAMAHVALEKVGETTPATIRLNPDDYTAVSAQRGQNWEGARVTILPDPAVTRGGCVVQSDFGQVDGALDAQFEQMTRALLGDNGGNAAHGGQ